MIAMGTLLCLAATQHEEARRAGEFVGFLIILLLFGYPALRSFIIARRPTTNTKCALSLGILLICVILSVVLTIILRLRHEYPGWIGLVALAILAGMVTSGILAILGLIEYSRKKEVYAQGRAQAIWTLSLLSLILAQLLFQQLSKPSRDRRAYFDSSAGQPKPGQWLTFEDLNFKIRAPGPPWVQVQSEDNDTNVVILFTLPNESVVCKILAEKGSTNSVGNLVELAKAQLRDSSDYVEVLKQEPEHRRGLNGIFIESDARLPKNRLLHRHWICETNGYVYQLMAFGKLAESALVRSKSEELFSTFSPVHPQGWGVLVADEAGAFQSKLYGYSVRDPDRKWRSSTAMAKNLPIAEYTGWNDQESLGLFVIPVCLLGQNPPEESLKHAMIQVLGFAGPGADIRNEKATTHRGLSGVHLRVEASGDGDRYDYHLEILRNENWAYLLGAYTAKDSVRDNVRKLDRALNQVVFHTPTNVPPELEARFNDQDKHRHGLVFNGIGLFYYNARQFENSADWFQKAFAFDPKNNVFLLNVANALRNAGMDREALDRLEKHPRILAESQPARAAQASLQLRLENVDQALANFSALFAEGYRDDNAFVEYVSLLSQTRQLEVALGAVERYLKSNDSATMRLLEARLRKQKGDFAKAIELLRTQIAKYPYNAELALCLADAYRQKGSYAEALEVCQKLIGNQGETAEVLHSRGCSELGLKRYREAKSTFEAALKKAPNSAEIKSYLDLVSGILGEGSNTALKEPIEAVAIPEKLLASRSSEPPASYVKDYGAYYVKSVTAISFAKKKEFKRTDYCVVKVLDSSGVAAFSTMQFTFDPLNEGMFVNELRVRDPEGKVVTTGNVADYYILDASPERQASHKKILNVPISGLRPGGTFELTVSRKDLVPPERFPFTTHASAEFFPKLQNILVIRGETNGLGLYGPAAREGTTVDGALAWVSERPEVYRWEPLGQEPADWTPALCLGDGSATWETEVKRYLAEVKDRMQLDASLRGLAAELSQGAKGEAEKILSLARHVQTNYTYKAVEFGRRARIPLGTSETARNRYGDCKDHALMLQQMLEASSIPSRLALVKTQGKVQKDLASLDQFDHMVVYLPGFRNGFFIDCTDKGSDLAQAVSPGLVGTEALILDPDQPRFQAIPEFPDEGSLLESQREVRITNGTDVVVHEVLSLHGWNGSAMRSYLLGLQPTARRTYVEASLSRKSAELVHFNVQHLEDTQSPLVFTMGYRLRGQFHLSGAQLTGKLPAVWEQLYASAEPVERRTTPFEVKLPLNVKTSITLNTPEGFAEPAPESFQQSGKSSFASSQSSAQAEASRIKIQYSLRRRAGKHGAAEYGTFRESMVKALAPLEQTIVFQKKAS